MDYSSRQAQEFCVRLVALIERLGPKAFGFHDLAILYSGPDWALADDIKKAAGGAVADNTVRSADQARDLGAIRIDDTPIGKWLTRRARNRFVRVFGLNDRLVKDAVFDAWATASREFVKSSFKHISTAVCGADPKRVFRAHELKVILTEATTVETINGIALQHYKGIYEANGKGDNGFYAAYVEICRTELEMMHKRALSATDHQDEAWEEYNLRKLFFDVELVTTATTAVTHATVASALAAVTGHHAAISGGSPSRPAPPPASALPPKVAHGH